MHVNTDNFNDKYSHVCFNMDFDREIYENLARVYYQVCAKHVLGPLNYNTEQNCQFLVTMFFCMEAFKLGSLL